MPPDLHESDLGEPARTLPAVLFVKALFTPLSWTLVALAKAVPAMVTTVPTDPLVRVNCLTFGFTLKTESLVSEPVGVVTEMGPVSAPVGTDVSICESKTSEKAAGIPLNAIWVARRRSRVRQRPWLRLARRGTPGSRALTGPGRSLSPALSVRPRREPRCPIVVASSAPMAPTRISTNATEIPSRMLMTDAARAMATHTERRSRCSPAPPPHPRSVEAERASTSVVLGRGH